MITGYNTDVECDGIVYHVQTEDKGTGNPIILSLVYHEGAILASKRTPYDDLVASGYDEAILAKRLSRQHKLICAAVHAGRIEELKQMDHGPSRKRSKGGTQPKKEQLEPRGEISESELTQRFTVSPPEDDRTLDVGLLEETLLRSGAAVTLRARVSRVIGGDRQAVPKARVTFKILGTSFRPESTLATSDQDGVAIMYAKMPTFTTGRAAILIRAEADGEVAELRRIILPE